MSYYIVAYIIFYVVRIIYKHIQFIQIDTIRLKFRLTGAYFYSLAYS